MGKTAVALGLIKLNKPPPNWSSPSWSPALLPALPYEGCPSLPDPGAVGHYVRCGTLVVAAQALVGQWKMEVEKFCGAEGLKLLASTVVCNSCTNLQYYTYLSTGCSSCT